MRTRYIKVKMTLDKAYAVLGDIEDVAYTVDVPHDSPLHKFGKRLKKILKKARLYVQCPHCERKWQLDAGYDDNALAAHITLHLNLKHSAKSATTAMSVARDLIDAASSKN